MRYWIGLALGCALGLWAVAWPVQAGPREDCGHTNNPDLAIQACSDLDETFERPAGFDLAAWWAQSLERFEASLPLREARIRLSAYGARRLTGPGQALAAAATPGDDGWREVTVPVEALDTAAAHFLALGRHVEVLEPPALRARLRDLAADVVARHE